MFDIADIAIKGISRRCSQENVDGTDITMFHPIIDKDDQTCVHMDQPNLYITINISNPLLNQFTKFKLQIETEDGICPSHHELSVIIPMQCFDVCSKFISCVQISADCLYQCTCPGECHEAIVHVHTPAWRETALAICEITFLDAIGIY